MRMPEAPSLLNGLGLSEQPTVLRPELLMRMLEAPSLNYGEIVVALKKPWLLALLCKLELGEPSVEKAPFAEDKHSK
jgi:hypothetical protein